MKLLDQYISRSVMKTIILVLVVFMGLEIFINFVGELNEIGRGSYGVGRALVYVLLTLPNQTYQLFPVAGLLGSLIGLGLLANHNELMVMRACGVSKGNITRSVMKIAIIIMVVVTAIGETAGPYLQHVADTEKNVAQSGGQALLTAQGTWLRQNQEFIHITSVDSSNFLNGVLIYKFDKNHSLKSTLFAQTAIRLSSGWQLNNVRQTIFQKDKTITRNTSSLPWDLSLHSKVFALGLEDPDELSLKSLWTYIQFRAKNKLQTSDYSLAFWRRIFSPLATLVMMFLAIPFVFGSLRGMTMGLRVFVGIVVGLVFFLVNELLSQLSIVVQMPAPVAVLFPIVIFALLGWLLMARSK